MNDWKLPRPEANSWAQIAHACTCAHEATDADLIAEYHRLQDQFDTMTQDEYEQPETDTLLMKQSVIAHEMQERTGDMNWSLRFTRATRGMASLQS